MLMLFLSCTLPVAGIQLILIVINVMQCLSFDHCHLEVNLVKKGFRKPL